MPVCTHTFGKAVSEGQPLHHPASVETQIQVGAAIKPLELFEWTTGIHDFGGPLREEAILFFIQEARLADDRCEVVDEMAAILDRRLRQSTAKRFQRVIPRERIEEFAAEVAAWFWCRVLDPTKLTASWAQISFWPCVFWLSQDFLKKENEFFLSIESSHLTMPEYLPGATQFSDPDNELLIGELMALLTPAQRLAFILRHSCGLILPDIAIKLSCSERTVRNLLKAARSRLRQALE